MKVAGALLASVTRPGKCGDPMRVVVESVPDVSCGGIVWQQGDARYATVVCKTTYSLVPDGPVQLTRSLPLLRQDVLAGGLVIMATDVALHKPRVDLLVTPPDDASPLRLGIFRGADAVWQKVGPFAPLAQAYAALKQDQREALKQASPVVAPDFDWSSLQTAPADQQLDEVKDGDWIVVEGALRTMLVVPSARADAAEIESAPLRADTVHIDLKRRRCEIVMRGRLVLPPGSDDVRVRIQFLAHEPRLAAVSPPEVAATRKPLAAQLETLPMAPEPLTTTLPVDARAIKANLSPTPFPKVASGRSAPPQAPPIPGAPWSGVDGPAPQPADPFASRTLADGASIPIRTEAAIAAPPAEPTPRKDVRSEAALQPARRSNPQPDAIPSAAPAVRRRTSVERLAAAAPASPRETRSKLYGQFGPKKG